jgi:hypothetical protein
MRASRAILDRGLVAIRLVSLRNGVFVFLFSSPGLTFTVPFNPAVVSSLSTQRNAVQMLHERIGVIVEYLDNVSKGFFFYF